MKISTAFLVFMAACLATCEANLFRRFFKRYNFDRLDDYLRGSIDSDDVGRNVNLLESNINNIDDDRARSAAQTLLELVHSDGRCDDNVLATLRNLSVCDLKLGCSKRVDKLLDHYLHQALPACQEYIKDTIDQVARSSSRLAEVVRMDQLSYTLAWSDEQDRPTALDVNWLLQLIGDEDNPDMGYKKRSGYYHEIDDEMFDRARNKFLVPPCRELIDQIHKLDAAIRTIKNIMRGTKPDPFDEIRFNTLKRAFWVEKICRKAVEWTSMDTLQLTEELDVNYF